jgi:hypothetical protein
VLDISFKVGKCQNDEVILYKTYYLSLVTDGLGNGCGQRWI